jgi:protein ImuA
VLAWLPPRLSPERLRRLQLAASAHDGPAFVLREWAAQHRPSASPLRLALQPGGADRLRLRILKRRGPPLAQALLLDLPPVLSPLAAERARRHRSAGMPSVGIAAACADRWAAGLPHEPLPGATFVQLDGH